MADDRGRSKRKDAKVTKDAKIIIGYLFTAETQRSQKIFR
jgi:hypothetical protein